MTTNPNPSRLFFISDRELAFLQKVARAEYQFITDEEQAMRQSLRDRLNEVVLNANEHQISVNLSSEELGFLALIVSQNMAVVTSTERDARGSLRDRLDQAAKAVGL